MNSRRRRFVIGAAAAGLVGAALAVGAGAGAQNAGAKNGAGGAGGAGDAAGSAVGVWYGTTFLGDPGAPTTPTIPFALTLHGDGTMVLTASDKTGPHPAFPYMSTPSYGTWQRSGGGVTFRCFEFVDGEAPPATFGILRISGACNFQGGDFMIGLAGFDVLPCPGGAAGCPSPSDLPFPAPDALVFQLERFR